MVNINKYKKSEKGQSTVEFALVIPIFLFLVFFILDVSWINYQIISFDYGYRQASWKISISDPDPSISRTLTGSSVSSLLSTNVVDNSIGVIPSNLTIYSATLNLWSDTITDKYPGSSYGSYEYQTNYWRYMRIRANFVYKIYPITPIGKIFFGSVITKSKQLDKERLLYIISK